LVLLVRFEMNAGTQIDRPFLQSMVEEYGLAVEELHASNRQLKSILDRAGNGHRTTAPDPPIPQPRRLPGDVSLAQLKSELTRLQEKCREVVRESMSLRLQAGDVVRAPHADAPAYDGKGLSKREREVLSLIVEGNSSKEIAAALGISFKTAVTHRASIMSKLNVHEIASVVREAIRRGLI
jgi:DNA-binding NarL/FixJ family response regulator